MTPAEIVARTVEYMTEHVSIKLEQKDNQLTAKLILTTGSGDDKKERVFSEDTIELKKKTGILENSIFEPFYFF